jgi:thiol-disulfide isomerase/thioredoxin
VSQKSARLTTLVCGSLLVLFFVALAVIPKYLRKTHFVLENAPQDSKQNLFTLDRPFTLVTKSGSSQRTTLKQFFSGPKGTLLVNFWATWCPPCVEELPSLEYLNRQLSAEKGPNRPRLVSISVDEGTAEILALFATLDFRPTFSVLHDPSGPFATEVGTVKFPETYWVDSEGKILYKWLGPQDWLSRDVLSRLAHLP